jgi:hypothetical protein
MNSVQKKRQAPGERRERRKVHSIRLRSVLGLQLNQSEMIRLRADLAQDDGTGRERVATREHEEDNGQSQHLNIVRVRESPDESADLPLFRAVAVPPQLHEHEGVVELEDLEGESVMGYALT